MGAVEQDTGAVTVRGEGPTRPGRRLFFNREKGGLLFLWLGS